MTAASIPAARNAATHASASDAAMPASNPPEVCGSSSSAVYARLRRLAAASAGSRARACSRRLAPPVPARPAGPAPDPARHSGDTRRTQHLQQMSGQPEAGDVGARDRADVAQDPRRRRVARAHARRSPPAATPRAPARACAPASTMPVPSGLVSISASPGRSPDLRSSFAGSARPVTAKPSAGSAASALWPPTSAQPSAASTPRGALQHVGQLGPHLVARGVGHGGHRQRRPRPRAHRVQVGQRVRRGDLAEHERVVDEGAEMIDALHHRHSRRRQHHRRIVRRVEADQHVGAGQARQIRQRAGQHLGTDLGAAAAAAHRVLAPAIGAIGCWYIRIQRRSIQSFQRHTARPATAKPLRQATARPSPRPEDRQRVRLRPPAAQCLAAGGAAQVRGQRRDRRAPPRRRPSGADCPRSPHSRRRRRRSHG